jgi:hypothetical protein
MHRSKKLSARTWEPRQLTCQQSPLALEHLDEIIFGRAGIASDCPGQEEFAVSWQLPIPKRKQ